MFDDNTPRLADILLKYREMNHFTQQFVADKIGVTRSAYTYYETGKTQPSMEALQILQKLMNRPTEEFFARDRHTPLYLSDGKKRELDFDSILKPQPKTMGELTADERELIANYRLASNIAKRKARNLLDPEYEDRKSSKPGY